MADPTVNHQSIITGQSNATPLTDNSKVKKPEIQDPRTESQSDTVKFANGAIKLDHLFAPNPTQQTSQLIQQSLTASIESEITQAFGSESESPIPAAIVTLSNSLTKLNQPQASSTTSKNIDSEEEKDSPGKASTISVTSGFTAITQTPQSKKQHDEITERRSRDDTESDDASSHRDTYQKFGQAVVASLISPTPEKKQELAKLRQELEKTTQDPSKIIQFESAISEQVQKDIRRQFKNATTTVLLRPKTSDDSSPFSTLEACQNMMALADQIAAFDQDELQGKARADIRKFIALEMDTALIELKYKGASADSVDALFKRFGPIMNSSGFNVGEYIDTWGDKIRDWGLEDFKNPTPTRGSMDNDRGSRQRPQLIETEMSDELIDTLQLLIIEQGITSGLVKRLQLKMQITKIKTQIKKSGISDQKLTELESQGQALARLRLVALLKRAYETRAVLPNLQSPESQLNDKKIRHILKCLQGTGDPITKNELTNIRDVVNQQMFLVLRDELIQTEIALQANPTMIALIRRRKDLESTINRLVDESGITDEIRPALYSRSQPKILNAAIQEAA